MPVDLLDSWYVVKTGRRLYYHGSLEEYERIGLQFSCIPTFVPPAGDGSELEKANLVSSEIDSGMHLPVIDCDYPIQAVPSSTPGHYHLYIDRPLTWQQYQALLDGLRKAGLIEAAWYLNAQKDRRSYVRLPHIRKKSPRPVYRNNDDEVEILPF